ncbi:conserved hypothetical protein [Vibrio chagasii]|nr:conserved hypothetical protein [Vibrio chagasii]CAH6996759.1 conserved hypothetical protein [Vibrio chagasii]CAH7128272.1 conserved hypothetical protein [Vibrio chagasii]CAH7383334.1 conserved hypothetical protein [Vibrio chagasii]
MFNLLNKVRKYYSNYSQYKRDRKRTPTHYFKKFNNHKDYVDLFKYFENERKDKYILGGTRVCDPEITSANGFDMDAIEGVSRYLPYLAVNILSMDNEIERLEKCKQFIDIIKLGTDHTSSNYWGDPLDYDQLVCESADIALSVWILRDFVWEDIKNKSHLVDWLMQCQSKNVSNNNWYLFKLIIQSVLNDLGEDCLIEVKLLEEVLGWEVQDGWFTDGKDGDIDLYTCWAINYSLFWIHLIQPDLFRDEILSILEKNAKSIIHLFDRNGQMPLFGRSVCYRLSVTVPLLTWAYLSNDEYDISVASYILSKNLNFYSESKVFYSGRITYGVYDDNIDFVDDYSGPFSSLWSLRSIIVAQYCFTKGINLLQVDADFKIQLPIESNRKHFLLDENNYCGDYVSIKNPNLNRNIKKESNRSMLRRYFFRLSKLRLERKVLHRDDYEEIFSSKNEFYKK